MLLFNHVLSGLYTQHVVLKTATDIDSKPYRHGEAGGGHVNLDLYEPNIN